MNSSFYNGISGIKTHQFGLDVWADNIANTNKVGFKSSIPEFSTVFSTTLTNYLSTPTSNDTGLGSRAYATHLQFSQGSVSKTENPFDLAINGDGWFGVVNQENEILFTRAGLFNKDSDGFLTDPSGNYLLGTLSGNIQNGAVIDNPVKDIDLSATDNQSKIDLSDNIVMPAKPTTQINFKATLDSKPIIEKTPDGNEIEIPNKESFTTSLINADGSESFLDIDFIKAVPQLPDKTVWSAKATLKDKDQNIIFESEGELNFNARGALVSNTLSSINNNGSQVSLNFGSLYDPTIANSGFDGLISYHGDSAGSFRQITNDGKKSGELLDYSIDQDGTIVAAFSNGESIPVAKIALFHFQNNAGLEQASPVYFKQTANSGTPQFFKDKDGKTIDTATISSHSLEMANLSMGTALTELIIMQKAFDASAKSITTSDQMIQNAINMKK